MLVLNYLAVRFVRLESNESWKPPDGITFCFLIEGQGEYSSSKLTRRCGAGDVLVVRRTAEAPCLLAGSSGLDFQWFSLHIEQLFPLFDASELSLLEQVVEKLGGLKHFPASSSQAIECQRLVANLPDEYCLEQRARVLTVAARILSNEFKTARINDPGVLRAEEHMWHVFQTLSEDELLNLSVPKLASKFACSRRHLNRLFHRYFGSSIVDFRMELRLKKVASLLRNPNLKIGHVAEQCGFNHLGHFNARFKHRFGLSPAKWRKQFPENSKSRQYGRTRPIAAPIGLRPGGLVPPPHAPLVDGFIPAVINGGVVSLPSPELLPGALSSGSNESSLLAQSAGA